ncbi:MAG: hypothetical protein Q4B57_04305 [Eubacteriales bacterium]|nr:hypothetical protein [Eubacteriales bacterium]
MEKHLVIDGNAFYELDEECMKRRCGQKRAYGKGDCHFEEYDGKASGREAGRENTGWGNSRTGESR